MRVNTTSGMTSTTGTDWTKAPAAMGTAQIFEGPKTLGKDSFLKLLVTELQYQDPLKPMENTEFVAQMAQFSSLEQMQNMNGGMTKLLTLSLMDRTVTAKDADKKEIQGTVAGIKFGDDGKVDLTVRVVGADGQATDREVAFTDVTKVEETPPGGSR